MTLHYIAMWDTSAPLRRVPSSLVAWELLFAFTSLVYEAYIVLGIDLGERPAWDFIGGSWHWYARSFDPVFLKPPPLLRLMCGLDFFVFGPFHLAAAYALHHRQAWIRLPAVVVNSMLGETPRVPPCKPTGFRASCTAAHALPSPPNQRVASF